MDPRPLFRATLVALILSSLFVGCADEQAAEGAPDAGAEEDTGESEDVGIGDVQADVPQAESFELTVVDGFGGGTFAAGAQVHVFAQVDPFASVVKGWSASVQGIELPAEWHFVLTMPAEDVTLTPEIVAVPMVLETIEIEGVNTRKRVIYDVPPEPRGVLFTFHGSGGSADIIFKPSMQYLARLAFERGYAVVSLDAEERTLEDPGEDGVFRWDASPVLEENVDLQNIALLSDALSARGIVPAEAPRFAVGMSNGGAFSVSVGAALPFEAATSFCATGRTEAWGTTETPTQWLMCSNDSNDTVASKRAQWRAGTESLSERGIPTDYDELPPSPLFEGRFARIEGVDLAASSAGVAELADKGVLDEAGFLLVAPAELAAEWRADPDDWPAIAALIQAGGFNLVLGEVKHAWADHQMHDDFAARALDFLEAQAP